MGRGEGENVSEERRWMKGMGEGVVSIFSHAGTWQKDSVQLLD